MSNKITVPLIVILTALTQMTELAESYAIIYEDGVDSIEDRKASEQLWQEVGNAQRVIELLTKDMK